MARTDVPTCGVEERLGEVRDRVRAEGWEACIVVNDAGVVMGLLRSEELAGDPEARIERVMRPGPSTYRPHVTILEMAELMERHDVANTPITRSNGTLVGLLRREDAVGEGRRLRERHEHDHEAHD